MPLNARRRLRKSAAFFRRAVLVVFVLLSGGLFPSARAADNPITVGDARFTVITASCVRLEYAADRRFVDASSLFAADRTARFNGFRLTRNGGATTIDTGEIRLTYTPDGSPFSPANLRAVIKKGAGTVAWTPGAPNPGNLGGTIRTLDGVRGPVDLGQGLLSRDGWYLLDDTKTPLLTADWVRSRPIGGGTDWYLFGYGDDYRAALKSLAAVGGPVPLPRKYALGAWYSRYWPFSSADYHQVVAEYAQHDFPLDNIVLDMDWHKDGWTGWSWNRSLLPDAERLLPWFHSQGLHDTLNLHPADGVGPQEDHYAAFMRDMGADPAMKQTLPFDAGSKSYMDALFKDVFAPLEHDGVDFWWLDWQQYPFTKSIPDLTNLFWLNTLLYQHTAQAGGRGLSFSRWAGWGDHRHPIHFSGDADAGFPMLAFEVPFTATAGNVGCFFWSHDIGGHNGGRNEESYVRWVQFGATSPVLRSHSSRDAATDRRPWNYPLWAENSMRVAFHLRDRLFPYLYSSAAQSCRDTVPLDRPLYLDDPGDEAAYHNAQEFLFGDDLLVAPIVTPGVGPGRVAAQTVWFPAGTWYNAFTGERSPGQTEALVAADIDEFPLYVRGGVPIPMQPYTPRMATTPLSTLVVRCYPGDDGKTGRFILYEDDGVSTGYARGQSARTPLSYTRRGDLVTVTVGPTMGRYAGQSARRGIIVELPDTATPSRATLGGRPLSLAYIAAEAVTRLVVPPCPIGQAVTVVVHVQAADTDALRAQAVARRLGAVLGHPAGDLQTALADTALTPAQRDSLLAVMGIGLVRKNQGAYLYGGAVRDEFYAPPGLIDGDAVTLGGGNGPVPLRPGGPLDASGPARNLHGRLLYGPGAVTFRIGRWMFHLPTAPSPDADLLSQANVAPEARVTVSGVENGYGFAGATDGLVGGYPGERSQEWSAGMTVGASLTLTWDTPQTIDRILLYDRPNTTDQITAARITFSDGTALAVGPLPNDAAKPLELRFPPRTVTNLTVTVTGVKPGTLSAGLAEIAAFRAR